MKKILLLLLKIPNLVIAELKNLIFFTCSVITSSCKATVAWFKSPGFWVGIPVLFLYFYTFPIFFEVFDVGGFIFAAFIGLVHITLIFFIAGLGYWIYEQVVDKIK